MSRDLEPGPVRAADSCRTIISQVQAVDQFVGRDGLTVRRSGDHSGARRLAAHPVRSQPVRFLTPATTVIVR
jgi:hypothetical protein